MQLEAAAERSDSDGLQREAKRLTNELLASASLHFGTKLVAPAIRFDLLGKSAGQVRTIDGRYCQIRYNADLLARYPQAFFSQTVPHESAHVMAFGLFGHRVRPHGNEWRAIMHFFGASPERCHGYDTDGLQTRRLRRYAYRCACRTHRLTSIRHNRIMSGQTYLCKRCKKSLERTWGAAVE